MAYLFAFRRNGNDTLETPTRSKTTWKSKTRTEYGTGQKWFWYRNKNENGDPLVFWKSNYGHFSNLNWIHTNILNRVSCSVAWPVPRISNAKRRTVLYGSPNNNLNYEHTFRDEFHNFTLHLLPPTPLEDRRLGSKNIHVQFYFEIRSRRPA